MNASVTKTPIHLWIIGIIAVLWNAMGVFDFVVTQIGPDWYIGEWTQERLQLIQEMPVWAEVSWAVAVFASLAGSVLLLGRSKYALYVFILALLGLIATTIHNYLLSNAMEVTGEEGFGFTLGLFVIAVFLIVYSAAMTKSGVLR